MLATAWLDLTEAILIGMALSALIFVWRASDVEVERKEVDLATLRKQGHAIRVLNMGGGFGIHYRKQEALPASAFASVILPVVEAAEELLHQLARGDDVDSQ